MTDAEFITAALTVINTFVIALMWISDRRSKNFTDLRKDIKDEFSRVNLKLDKMDKDIVEIRERVTFLEAANIYTMPIEPIQPNLRSMKAKEIWRRRKQKNIEHKEKKD